MGHSAYQKRCEDPDYPWAKEPLMPLWAKSFDDDQKIVLFFSNTANEYLKVTKSIAASLISCFSYLKLCNQKYNLSNHHLSICGTPCQDNLLWWFISCPWILRIDEWASPSSTFEVVCYASVTVFVTSVDESKRLRHFNPSQAGVDGHEDQPEQQRKAIRWIHHFSVNFLFTTI